MKTEAHSVSWQCINVDVQSKASKAPKAFAAELDQLMKASGDTSYSLRNKLASEGIKLDPRTIRAWRKGSKHPETENSFRSVAVIERHYGLQINSLLDRLPRRPRAVSRPRIKGISASEQRRLAWHLPLDFSARPVAERKEILAWVRRVVISGSTEYRKYHASTIRQRYSVLFPKLSNRNATVAGDKGLARRSSSRNPIATTTLSSELEQLIKFKADNLTPVGFQRNGRWGAETVAQKIEHLGLFFGALVAAPTSEVKGFGADIQKLCIAMLIFPSVWDFYLQWREARRGFFTAWEVDMLWTGLSLVRNETGWLRQRPDLSHGLQAVPGLISEDDIHQVRQDWSGACEVFYKFAVGRAKEIQKIVRVHRDPFEPILPVLEAPSPVDEYKKIADEILKWMPDKKRYPVAAAESVRSLLMLRLGLHLGVRQKNLRQLWFRRREQTPTPEKLLVQNKCGELRWSERDQGWEVLIPAIAFKNEKSSFFGNRSFRLLLPDLGDLYALISDYISVHREVLLKRRFDSNYLFVKTVKRTTSNPAFSQNNFYDAWRLMVQRYGIYNPYTKRGAIRGLLPHGPHNIRDVLATHILKVTGSFEQASYAIQDTPEMVAKHYGRFLPEDKTALAAKILNRVWEVN